MALFVDAAESVARQLKRGRQIVAHNEEVSRSGVGERWEKRASDFSEGLARNRLGFADLINRGCCDW